MLTSDVFMEREQPIQQRRHPGCALVLLPMNIENTNLRIVILRTERTLTQIPDVNCWLLPLGTVDHPLLAMDVFGKCLFVLAGVGVLPLSACISNVIST